jgi:hypothetical protein
MKLAQSAVLFAAAFFALAAAPLEDPTYSLNWKPTLGQTITYALSMKISGGESSLEITSEIEGKVSKLEANGDYTVETRQKSGKMVIDGESHEVPDDGEADVEVFNAKGEKITKKDGEEAEDADPFKELLAALDFTPPEKPVKKGDKWVRKMPADPKTEKKASEVEYEVLGEEQIGTYKTVRISVKYRQTEGDKPTTATGSIAFDMADMSMVKTEATILFTPEEEDQQATVKFEMNRK